MTQKQITQKLRKALSEDIAREADVVYILAECRKLLEEAGVGDPHFGLKLYCHWALHVDLSGRDTTLPFLSRVDRFVDCVLRDANFDEQNRMFQELGFLQSFRQLLGQFLASHALPTDLCDDDARWHWFLGLYADVIEDGSISCNAQPGDLRHLSGVTFCKGRPAIGCYLPFDMVWQIRLINGKAITVNVRAFDGPHGDRMMFHGVRLDA
jgi:hypothetical protein